MTIVYKFKNNLYINLTNRCTNRCIFCNQKILEKYVSTKLFLEREPSAEEILNELLLKLKQTQPNEIVFCGFGEPLLRLPEVMKILKELKKIYPGIPTRLNTNGQAMIYYPKRNVASGLKKAGLNKISISVNALNANEYLKLCRPRFGKITFNMVIRFVKTCKNEGLFTQISFVDYGINKEKCKKFAEKLGVEVLLRNYIHL